MSAGWRGHGSIQNALGRSSAEKPEVGMGVTVYGWTDRHAGTISRVSASGRTFWFRHDKATRTDNGGMTECQTYTFEPQPDAPEYRVYKTKHKGWYSRKVGKIGIGHRSAYHDYSF